MGTFFYYTVLSLLITVAVLLILLILIQKGRGGGLSGAFGGGGGGSSAFGAKTGDVLTWATSIIFGVFILLAVSLDLIVDSQWKTTLPSTTQTPSTLPTPAANLPPEVTPIPPTSQPVTSSPISSLVNSVKSNLAPTTQAAGNNLMQDLHNAATQTTGAVNATTQPLNNLLKGGK